MRRILLIKNNTDLLNSISDSLKSAGYDIYSMQGSEIDFNLFSADFYDLIILELDSSTTLGFDLLKKLLNHNKNTKILVISLDSTVDLKIKALDLGASDFLVSPFFFEELDARIRVLLRKDFLIRNSIISFGDLMFNTVNRTLFAKGNQVTLTKKETAIIEYLIINNNKVVSTEELLDHTWGSKVNYFSNSIRVHLSSLRKKIKNHLGYNPIVNKSREGYYLIKEKEENLNNDNKTS